MTLESTEEFAEVAGICARIWHGKSERGSRLVAVILTVGIDVRDNADEANADLIELMALGDEGPAPLKHEAGH